LAVEVASFPFPWPREAFVQELENAWSTIEVLTDPDGRVVAFVVYWIIDDELHLLDIAVHPDYRRAGVGRHLMDRIESVGRENGLTYLTLEVRVSNRIAIGFYEKLGYLRIHRRKGYYVDAGEDGWVMAKVLGPA
jgi:ribosomal-protein-alanine N-acetyltransferase